MARQTGGRITGSITPMPSGRAPLRFVLLVSASALLAGCQTDSIVTGSVKPDASLATPTAASQAGQTAATQKQLAEWAKRYKRRPGLKKNAIGYAYLLRRAGQAEEAVGVLQRAVMKHPEDREVLIAYGKAMADTGRTKEAVTLLQRAESSSQADWDYMSTMGAMHDQLGDHNAARGYYEKALALAPGEPRVLSNLGLSYALTRDLKQAEETLRQASTHPKADNRVRQNLALVLGLQGKFKEAEEVARKDLPPEQAAQNVAVLRQMLSQQNTWDKIEAGG